MKVRLSLFPGRNMDNSFLKAGFIAEHGMSEKPPALKLILKVGGNISTPEHSNDSFGPGPVSSTSYFHAEDESMSLTSAASGFVDKHKKMKKKKKKREKDKNRDKHEKKHKHRHKEKRKRNYDEERMSTEEPISEQHAKKIAFDAASSAARARMDNLKPSSPGKGGLSPRSVEASRSNS